MTEMAVYWDFFFLSETKGILTETSALDEMKYSTQGKNVWKW
jgi:hypothetical protein